MCDDYLMQPTNNEQLKDFIERHVIFVHVTTPAVKPKNDTKGKTK